ncbi:transmembrane protein, putative, partial [Bodo saltans]
ATEEILEDMFVVQAMGPKERQRAVDSTQNAWRSDPRRRDFERSIASRNRVLAGSPSSPSTMLKMQMLFCPYYEVDQHSSCSSSHHEDDAAVAPHPPPRRLSIPSSATYIGDNACDCYVADSLLVTVSSGKSGDAESLVTAYFHPSLLSASASPEVGSDDAPRRGSGSGSSGSPQQRTYTTRSIFIASQGTLTCTVLESATGSSTGWSAVDTNSKTVVLMFDVSAMRTFLWDPFTGAVVALGQRLPRQFPWSRASEGNSTTDSVGASAASHHHHHHHPTDHPMPHRTTSAATTVECQEMFVLTPKQQAAILLQLDDPQPPPGVQRTTTSTNINGSIPAQSLSLITASTVLAFLSVERSGLGGGEKRQYFLNFTTLDASLKTKLLLKGKSLLATLPSSAEVIIAMWTASSAPPHPLFEATECGIGAIIRFGRAMLETVTARPQPPPGVQRTPSTTNGGIPAQSPSLITASTVLAFLSVERSGLGGGEKRQYFLNFTTLDASLKTKLLLKGKSLLATLPSSAEVIIAMWTASSAPPHPLFEATECGIGAIIRFGRAMLEKLRSGEQEKTSRRMVWAIWASVVVMGLSFVTTVLTLVYNGWWLHMQFLFSPSSSSAAPHAAGSALSYEG